MATLRFFSVITLAISIASGLDFATISQGCDSPQEDISASRGCFPFENDRLKVLGGATTTEGHNARLVAFFIYTGDNCDGTHSQLPPGTCFDTEGFHSAKVIYDPDNNPDKILTTQSNLYPMFNDRASILLGDCSGATPEFSLKKGTCVDLDGDKDIEITSIDSDQEGRANNLAVWLYTGQQCEGNHGQLGVGVHHTTAGFKSFQLVFLPDEESASRGVKLGPAATQHRFAPIRNSRAERHRLINGPKHHQTQLEF